MAARIVPEGGHRLKPFKHPRVRCANHLAFIRRLPCVACMSSVGLPSVDRSEAAHLAATSLIHGKPYTGQREKADDRWTLPLCPRHHAAQHKGSETNFWKLYGIDPFLLALVLWGLTGDDAEAVDVIERHGKARF